MKKRSIGVLSLFDGISCGRIALERAGFENVRYYASEVDKYAMEISSYNYPDTLQFGDVKNWKKWNINWSEIDLLIGGSPCQDLSQAGKGKGLKGERSGLFFDYVDILNHIKKFNPNVKFLLENVRMKQEYQDIISECLGVNPVAINSSLVSAQRRYRLYWTNIAEIEQPEDKKILLKDILEGGCDLPTLREKSKTVRAGGRGSYDRHEWDSADDEHKRKFNIIECERLQTLPDNYTDNAPKTHRFNAVGNGWTVDVVAHIFKYMRF